jgi:hypothetical protein
VIIPSSKIGDLAAQFQSKALDPSAVRLTHNSLGFSYDERNQDVKGRPLMSQPKWLLKQHIEHHASLALAYAHTIYDGIPCDAPNCSNCFNVTSSSCHLTCSVHVCNRCHYGFWCSKDCYEDSMSLHDMRCYDSPAYNLSESTFQTLWPQYQAAGATISTSSSSSYQTSTSHPVAQTNMGPPATVNRTDATPAITNWPTQPGLENGIQCPTSGWRTNPAKDKYDRESYSHHQVLQGTEFEYHSIRGAYIIKKDRNGVKRLDYGNTFKLFLATQQDLAAETIRIDTARKHRKKNDRD